MKQETVKNWIIGILLLAVLTMSAFASYNWFAQNNLVENRAHYNGGYQQGTEDVTQQIVGLLKQDGFFTLTLPTLINETPVNVTYKIGVIGLKNES